MKFIIQQINMNMPITNLDPPKPNRLQCLNHIPPNSATTTPNIYRLPRQMSTRLRTPNSLIVGLRAKVTSYRETMPTDFAGHIEHVNKLRVQLIRVIKLSLSEVKQLGPD